MRRLARAGAASSIFSSPSRSCCRWQERRWDCYWRWTLDLLRVSNAWGISRLDEVEINRWVLVFTTFVAVLTGLLTGLMPSSKLVRTLIVEDDYEVATVEEAEQLQADLRAAVDLISDSPSEANDERMSDPDSNLLQVLLQAAGLATAR